MSPCFRKHPIGRDKWGRCRVCRRGSKNNREKNWATYSIQNPDGSPFKISDYDRAFLSQAGKCAICCVGQTSLRRRLAADHDHRTGTFRGLLCPSCNRRLGAKEDATWSNAADKYLQRLS